MNDRIKRHTLAICFSIATALGAAQADAQETRGNVEGTIVGTDGSDLVVDVGTNRGAANDAVVEVWRTMRVKHPVTGAIIVDRFRIGSLKLIQARPNLSLATAYGQATRPPAPGDIVVVVGAAPVSTTKPAPVPTPPTDAATPTPTPNTTAAPTTTVKPTPPPAPVDVEAAQLSALFDTLQHMPPEQRADKYDEYTRAHPTSRFFFTLREESHALRRPQPVAPAPCPVVHVDTDQPEVPNLLEGFLQPSDAYANGEIELVVELKPAAKGAVLYVRKPEGETYAALPMRDRTHGYYSAKVPAALVTSPSMPYFIEAIDASGKPVPVVGSAGQPITAPVEDAPTAPTASPVHLQFALWTDFATFSTSHFNDYVSQTEGMFAARFRDVGLRAFRTGFGVYRGVGGTLDELDKQGSAGRSVGLTYGYLETELAPITIFSFVARGVLGLGQDKMRPGMQLFVRIGNDLGTSLLLGGEAIGGVGVRGITELDWAATKRLPVMFRAEVTNQPAGTVDGDVGVRLIAQVGYRVTNGLTLALRGSYQGRTIDHAGPGGGAAVMYQW